MHYETLKWQCVHRRRQQISRQVLDELRLRGPATLTCLQAALGLGYPAVVRAVSELLASLDVSLMNTSVLEPFSTVTLQGN